MSLASLSLATTLVGLMPHTAAADSCTPSKVMVVLDKSSSMQTGSIGGVTKWAIAVDALDQVMASHEDQAEFGLMTFPQPDECGPGALDVAPQLGARAAMMSILDTAPPSAGNWTPMAQTLDAAAVEPSLAIAGDAPRFVVLISDGWQYCAPYDASTRFDAVDSVTSLTAQGVTTFVVGFGAQVDAAALNQMAVQAGTARPGCNPANDDPADAAQCYFQADNAAELVAALDFIAGSVAEETCDGVDNDCDGEIDENLNRACDTACGSGTEVCTAGAWAGCDAEQPTTETCDGIDNDCDGTTDPGCDCTAGETRTCGDFPNEGQCHTGNQICSAAGQWGGCEGAVGPSEEMCDGIDNNCNGQVDEYPGTQEIADLCDGGEVCENGMCQPVEPGLPPDEGQPGDGTVTSGCGCTSGSTSAGGVLPLLLVGAMLMLRRRRMAA